MHLQVHTYFFQIIFHYRLLQGVEYSCLCYTVSPCLFYIQQFVYVNPMLPTLSLPPFSDHKFDFCVFEFVSILYICLIFQIAQINEQHIIFVALCLTCFTKHNLQVHPCWMLNNLCRWGAIISCLKTRRFVHWLIQFCTGVYGWLKTQQD